MCALGQRDPPSHVRQTSLMLDLRGPTGPRPLPSLHKVYRERSEGWRRPPGFRLAHLPTRCLLLSEFQTCNRNTPPRTPITAVSMKLPRGDDAPLVARYAFHSWNFEVADTRCEPDGRRSSSEYTRYTGNPPDDAATQCRIRSHVHVMPN